MNNTTSDGPSRAGLTQMQRDALRESVRTASDQMDAIRDTRAQRLSNMADMPGDARVSAAGLGNSMGHAELERARRVWLVRDHDGQYHLERNGGERIAGGWCGEFSEWTGHHLQAGHRQQIRLQVEVLGNVQPIPDPSAQHDGWLTNRDQMHHIETGDVEVYDNQRLTFELRQINQMQQRIMEMHNANFQRNSRQLHERALRLADLENRPYG